MLPIQDITENAVIYYARLKCLWLGAFILNIKDLERHLSYI